MIYILAFQKNKYNREEIESLDDVLKFNKAAIDSDNCKIMTASEYMKNLNDSKPMDRYVYTYIVEIND